MAKDAWSRFREKEEARVEEERKSVQEQMRKIDPSANIDEGATVDKLLIELLGKCEIMMEQISNLYNMWLNGMERTPPTVQRKHLEDLLLKIQAAPKPTANLKFRVSQFHTKYGTYKDKWDRLLKDVESGARVVKRRGSG
jgi:hypothetical protein